MRVHTLLCRRLARDQAEAIGIGETRLKGPKRGEGGTAKQPTKSEGRASQDRSRIRTLHEQRCNLLLYAYLRTVPERESTACLVLVLQSQTAAFRVYSCTYVMEYFESLATCRRIQRGRNLVQCGYLMFCLGPFQRRWRGLSLRPGVYCNRELHQHVPGPLPRTSTRIMM